jgi:hypothetical protein
VIYLYKDISVPPEHDLSCVSQHDDLWRAVCKCGFRSEWDDRESWALMDWRIHVERLLMQPGIAHA